MIFSQKLLYFNPILWVLLYHPVFVNFPCTQCSQCTILPLFRNKHLATELKMTEWKSEVPYLSSSQSSIAALKNVLADGRLTSSPPLPPTTHPLSHPPTTHIPYTYWGGLWVSQRVWGGKGCRARQSATLCRSRAQNYTCGKRAVPYLYSLYTVFHSVVFNSVYLAHFGASS